MRGAATHLRAWVRIAALVLLTAHHYFWWLLTRLLVFVSRDLARRTNDAILSHWAGWAGRLMGMRLEVLGPPPEPPFLLVCNHLSYMDILALGSEVRTVFLSKAEIAHWPVMGFLARSTGTLFVDRARKADLLRTIEEIRRTVSEGRGVVVFPEGTSSGGDGVLPFKPSVLEVAVKSEIPVATASITYRTHPGETPARASVCWWAEMDFFPHVYALLRMRGFEATVTFSEERLAERDRKLLAERAHEAVSAGFTPVGVIGTARRIPTCGAGS